MPIFDSADCTVFRDCGSGICASVRSRKPPCVPSVPTTRPVASRSASFRPAVTSELLRLPAAPPGKASEASDEGAPTQHANPHYPSSHAPQEPQA